LPDKDWNSIKRKANLLGLKRLFVDKRAPKNGLSTFDRFLNKVNKDSNIFGENNNYPTQCWIWTGAFLQDRNGKYGLFRYPNGQRAHRYSYEYFINKISEDHEIDHLCRNTLCVNPEHLEAVTHKENILRGKSPQAMNNKKTHCKRGHLFTEQNTYKMPSGGRRCILCRRLLEQQYNAAKKN